MLSKNEFNVLVALNGTPSINQREIASKSGISLGSANAALKSLTEKGMVSNGAINTEGKEALSPFKVDNAIIMAAGLSSRFAPISYEKPKGLLRVRGEVLIERQIKQLKEAGINDITVVAGYKKEYFFYLEDTFGVTIVINPEYASRNNNSTLMRVREKLGNTFICSSDDYFTENPFEPYVYQAYYAAQFCKGETPEWCIDENLNKLAAQTMTAITILSVAFLTPSQLLFSYYSFGSIEITGCQRLLATAYIVLLFLLVASFLLALASRLLRKSEMLDAPGTIFNDFANQIANAQKAGERLSDKDLADYYCASISPFFETTRKKNEQAWRLIKMSICLLSFTALLASLFLAIAFVGYIS